MTDEKKRQGGAAGVPLTRGGFAADLRTVSGESGVTIAQDGRAVEAAIVLPLRGAQCKSCPYAGPCGRAS
jgi:hypothetical protein